MEARAFFWASRNVNLELAVLMLQHQEFIRLALVEYNSIQTIQQSNVTQLVLGEMPMRSILVVDLQYLENNIYCSVSIFEDNPFLANPMIS